MLHADAQLTMGTFTLDAQLRAEPGELVVLVGPNGAGKTTLLRTIAGVERISHGHIELDGKTLDDAAGGWVPPHDRSVGYIPQGDLLLPHLDALSNVAFGLRCRGVSRSQAREQAAHWLDVVGLAALGGHRPHQLSGGEAKRVAIARALAIRPRVLLLDEPFAGLDATMRREIRHEIRTYLQSHDGVRILVTHEPVDALALADRIVVLEHGRVVQDAPAEQLRVRPRSRYIADLVGINLYRGTLTANGLRTDSGVEIVATDAPTGGGAGLATVHPRAVALYRERPEGSPRNVWPGTVTDVDDEGDRVRVRIEGPLVIVAEVTHAAVATLAIAPGDRLFASTKATDIGLYPA